MGSGYASFITMPFGVLQKMAHSPFTDAGLASFLSDWAKVTGKR